MTKSEQTWTVLSVVTLLALLYFWLKKKESQPTTRTQTSVTLEGTTTSFPTRTDNNNVQLRICTYDSGAQLTLNPLSVNGNACPPVYIDVTGKQGNLVKDELLAVPQAGQNTFASNPGQVTPNPATDNVEAI